MKTRFGKAILKSLLLIASVCGISVLVGMGAVHAHDLWITVDQPVAGKPLHAVVGWGHAFPDVGTLEKEKLAPAFLLSAKGRTELKPGDKQDFLTAAPVSDGSYAVVGGRKEGWYTKTPEGSKDLPRSQVPDAVSCVRSAKFGKALVNVGKAKEDLSANAGQTLEIIPLKNPGEVKPNGDLPIQVLFEGKPLTGAQVLATFGGFSQNSSSFAFAGKTDKDGKTEIKCWSPGLWLVLVKHELPFPNLAECDKLSYGASMTFEIK